LSNPRDLFLQLLAEALYIERMLVFEVLPQVRKEVDSEWLAEPVAEHLEQTREHAARLERVFLQLGAEPASAASPPFEGLRRQHDEEVEKLTEPRLKDIFLAGAAARTEHLEIAIYSSLLVLAGELGVDPSPLEENLREEEQALKRVQRAAEKLRERLPA
jgi:ferritin-like metal-binding protein YciE